MIVFVVVVCGVFLLVFLLAALGVSGRISEAERQAEDAEKAKEWFDANS